MDTNEYYYYYSKISCIQKITQSFVCHTDIKMQMRISCLLVFACIKTIEGERKRISEHRLIFVSVSVYRTFILNTQFIFIIMQQNHLIYSYYNIIIDAIFRVTLREREHVLVIMSNENGLWQTIPYVIYVYLCRNIWRKRSRTAAFHKRL